MSSRTDYCSAVVLVILVSLACSSWGLLNSELKQFILDRHNEARSGIGAPNMRKMGWSEELAVIAEDTASTCSIDPTPLGELIPAVDFKYSWIVENRYTASGETNIQMGLSEAFQCWLDGTSCTTNEIRYDEITYPDSYLIGCGAHYFPTSPICRNFGTGVRVICYYAPGAPESYTTRVGEPCSSCPDEAPLCDSQLCVPPDDSPLPSVPEDNNNEDNTDTITPKVTDLSPDESSFGGGTLITIEGVGFADDPFSVADDPNIGNQVTFYNGDIRLPCVVERYYTTTERILCRTSASPDQVQRTYTLQVTINGKELSEFEGASYCGGTCTITYKSSFTPIISSISPHAKIPGDDPESVSVNGKVFSYLVADTQEPNEGDEDRELQTVDRIIVGGELCDPYVAEDGGNGTAEDRSLYGGEVDSSGNGHVSCRPETVRIDSMNVSVVLSDSGTSIIQKNDYALDNKFRKYIFQTHSDITSVEPNTGSPNGGTLITVHGKHFTDPLDDIKVDISGVPCEIVSHNSTTIKCITGPAPPMSEVYPGGRGLAREVWLHDSLYSFDPDTIKSRPYGYPNQSYTNWVIQERFYRDSGYQPEFGESTYFQQRYTGFFVPPMTGTYTFNLYSDDLMDVFLSSDTTRANMKLVAYTNSWTQNSWNRYSTQLSDPIHLVGGQAYYLETRQTQGTGPWQIGLGAKIHNLTWTEDYALADHEKQQIRIRSSAFKETQLITVISQPKIQRVILNLNDDNTIQFTLSFKDVSTTTFTQNTLRSTIEDTLNDLSTIESIGEVEVEREKTGDYIQLTIYFVSNEPILDDIIVSNYTSHESVILQQPQSHAGTGFTITHDSRTTESVNGTTSDDDLETELYKLITTECTVTNEGNVHYYDGYEVSSLSTQWGGSYDNFETSYCGRFSIRNPRFIYRPVRGYSSYTVNSFQNRYVCFHVRGKIPNSIIGFRTKYLFNSNRWRRISNIQSTYSNNEWQDICVDVFDKFDELLGPPKNGVSFTIDYIYFDYPNEGEDFWIDEFRITSSSSPRVTQVSDKIAARPNNIPIDSISVSKKSVDLVCPDEHVPSDCQLQIVFTVKYTVEQCMTGIPLTTVSGSHVTVTRSYAGSPPVEGSFNVSFEDKTINGVSPMIEEAEMTRLLQESFGGIFDVDRHGSCHGYIWDIRWEDRGGDLPMMSVNGSGLTGDSPTIEVNPITDGGVWLRPFRGDMLRLPELTPQVQVTVNGIPASCRSRNCSFTFPQDQAATVTSLSPSMGGQDGSTITIQGTRFPMDMNSLTVTIGDKNCDIQSTNGTHIVCIPAQNVAGIYPVKVLVSGSGFAIHPINYTVMFEYSIVVEDIQSSEGSVFGGNIVTLHGAGFPDLNRDMIYNDSTQYGHYFHSDVYVLFDDLPCFIKSSNFSMLSCTPQPHQEDTVNVTVQVNTVVLELEDAYYYSINHTGIVSTVTPSMGGVSGGDTVTINGQNFGDDVMVMIGDEQCDIQSLSSNAIVCTTSPHRPGPFNVIVTSRKYGAASIHPSELDEEDFEQLQIPFEVFLEMDHEPRMLSNVSLEQPSSIQFPIFTYQLLVSSLTPLTGSLAGGTEVTITGKGFDNSVVVMATATNQSCDISHISYSEIKCTMPSTVKTHTIKNSGIHPELGPYFAWEPSEIRIESGSKVTWEWSGSAIMQSFEVHQVSSLNSNDRIGFQSESSIVGSFSYVFTEPGTYFYATDVNSNLFPMSGKIVVEPNEDIITEVQVTVGNFTAMYNVSYPEAESIGSGMSESGCLSWDDIVSDRVYSEPPVFIHSKCSTPVVREIQSDYSTLSSDFKIIGQRLSTSSGGNTSVSFGNVSCHVSELMDDSLVCNLDKQAQPQPYMPLPLKLKVHNLGYALLLGYGMLNRSVQLNPSVSSVEPISGSVFGGNNVTISGEAFSSENMMVMLGSAQCEIISVTYNTIICKVPSSGNGIEKNTTVNVTVYNSIDNQQAVTHGDVEYAYSTDYTPMVMMVSPRTVSGVDPTMITITGELLSGDSTVTVGTNHECANVVEVDSENIRCLLDPIPGATYSLNVFVPEYGYASVSVEDRITSELRADAVSPPAGSIRGGTTITVSGIGFSTVMTENSVRIGGNACRITSSNYTSITCITPDNRANGTLDLSVSVSVTDNIRTITKRNLDSGSLQFDFSADLTPMITSVSPSEGQQGDSVTISGSLLQDAETVFIGSAECTITDKTDTTITCVLGQNFVGTYGVMATVPSLGTADGDLQFTYILRVTDMMPIEGSFAGSSLLTINGVGFSPIASFVTVCDRPCLPSNTPPSLTSLTCIIPSFAEEVVSMGSKACDVVVESLSYNVTVPGEYTFRESLTPTVTAINDTRGGTAGGTKISLTGMRFGAENATVTIDGIPCEVLYQTMTEIICETGPIGRTVVAQVMVYVPGSGFAIVSEDVYFYYVDLWSSRFTWGGTELPQEGDFVIIGKGQTLVLDTVTSILKILLIQGGELIFDDVPTENGIKLRSELILITDGGRLQIGTEDEPYQNQAEIVLYGNVLSTELPLFGAKTLAVRNGTVDFHGKPITSTWTRLSETVEAGSSQLKVQHDVSDWYIGGKIVLASTSYSQRENEELTIQSISADGLTITLEEPVQYRHIFFEQTIEGRFIQTAAEVGLLTRNIVFRGNTNEEWDIEFEACEEEFQVGQFDRQTCFNGRFGAETVGDQFGAQLMFHKGPRDKVIGRLEYTEFTHVGQAFRLGRYPIHFHLNGNVSDSYVRGNGIHHTFNRAVTIHAVDYLLVEKNVAYNILGHAYFLEDGIEQGNIIQYNLGVFVRASSSLLNVDITPATYWAVNPYNIFRGNAAAGGTHFGFWYRLPQHPTGPSFTTSVRPINLPLLEFNNNTAHSFGWYGIWIFPSYYPGGIDLCNEVTAPAVFSNFLAWRNNRGIEFSEVGAVQLKNSIMIDNLVAGVEYTKVSSAWGKNGALVEDVLIVGHSALREYDAQRGGSVCSESGLKGPHSYYLTVSNVTFVNFNESGCVAIRACSHCRTFQGGYETRYEKTSLVNSPNVITWNWEHEQVIKDLDGTLTGIVNGSLIPHTNTLPSGDCEAHSGTVGAIPGAKCNGNVRFNRFALRNPTPSSLTFRDLNVTNSHGTTELFYVLKRIEFAPGYMAILPTNTDYILEWADGERFTNISYDAQFTGMTYQDHFFIQHDFPRSIDHININGITVNASIDKPDPLEAEPGDWYTNPNTTTLTYFFKGFDTCPRSYPITFSTYRCFYENCIPPPPPEPTTPLPPGSRPNVTYMWSDTSIWPDGVVPTGENAEVTINKTLYVVVSESDILPHFKRLTILGALEILDDADRVIKADLIIIDEGGRLVAGTPTESFTHKLSIVLNGTIKALESPVYRLPNGGPVLGTKAIGVFGLLSLHGEVRMRTWTFLSATAAAGSNQLTLQAPVDWTVGEEIVIASTSFEANEAEVHTISAVSSDKLTITLSSNLQYEHLGGMHNIDSCSVSVSAEVGLLTRNIKITGTMPGSTDETAYNEDYGCRVLVSTYIASDGQQWTGSAQLSGVEFHDCGQEGFVESFDPRYVLAFLNIGSVVDNSSYVTDCSIHDGYNVGIGVYGTNGMALTNNVIHNTIGASVDLTGRQHEVIDNLAVLAQFPGTYKRNDEENQEWTANFKLNEADDFVLIGNSAAGGGKCGFDTRGENCIAEGFVPQWRNNIAHSTLHGVHIGYRDGHTQGSTIGCSALHNFHIYSCYHFGIFAYSGAGGLITESTFVNNYAAIFNGVIGPAALSHEVSQKTVTIANSRVIGALHEGGTVRDCTAYTAKPEIAFHKRSHSGIQSPSGGHVGIVLTIFSSGSGGFPKFPWQTAHNYPAIAGLTTLRNVTFCKFGTHCGSRREVALMNHPDSEDAQHPVELMETQMIDVESNSKFFNSFPKLGSINPSDCVDMDCDGYKKILIRDLDGKFTETNEGNLVTLTSNSAYEWGMDESRGLGDYRIPRLMLAEPDGGRMDPNVTYPKKGIYRGTNNCQFNTVWNSNQCTGIDHMMMVIESLDADTEVRRLSPIGLGADGYIDLVNGPQDHGWCGGYTCQERISTFYTIVAIGLDYAIGLTSTNPQDMRMIILNGVASQKIQVGLFYNSPQRLDIYVDNQYIKPTNGYFDSEGNLRYSLGSTTDFIPEVTDEQGSNFYDRTYKKLYFILQGDKPVTIVTSPVIQLGINLPPITVDEFFETNLVMNLALLLDIPQNRIRVVNVVSESSGRKRQTGSTRVEIEISDPPRNTTEPSRNNSSVEYPTTYPNTTSAPPTDDTEFKQLQETATQVAEVIQTGALAKSIGHDILDASLVPPEPEVVDPTGGVRASEGEGGPQPGDNGTETLETFDEIQRMAEQNNTESSSTVTLSIPSALNALSLATEGVEGIAFNDPIVIAMLDGIGAIVTTLGYNSPWKLQAVIESGPDNGFLTNDTVDMIDGRAVFTDLVFSHPGTYRLTFRTVLPADASFTLPATTDITIAKRDLKIYIDQQPPTEANTTFMLYPYPSISIRDEDNNVVKDLTWRGDTWYGVATLIDTSTQEDYGSSVRMSLTDGIATFSEVNINDAGTYLVRFSIETDPVSNANNLPMSVDSNEISVIVLPFTRFTVTYDNDYASIVANDVDLFIAEFTAYMKQIDPSITIYNVTVSPGSIIVSFFATASDVDDLLEFTTTITTEDTLNSFMFNGVTLNLNSTVQDLRYPITFPTESPKLDTKYLIIVIVSVAIGSVILLALIALTCSLFCYYGTQRISGKKSTDLSTRENDYEKFPMGTIYSNKPIFDEDDNYPAFHVVMDETNNKLSVAKESNSRPTSRASNSDSITKEKDVRYISSKEIKVGDSKSVTVYNQPQMTQGDYEDNMSLDELLVLPAMNGESNNNNSNNNNNSVISLPPAYVETYELPPNTACDPDVFMRPPVYRTPTPTRPRPSPPPSATSTRSRLTKSPLPAIEADLNENGEEEIIGGLKITTF